MSPAIILSVYMLDPTFYLSMEMFETRLMDELGNPGTIEYTEFRGRYVSQLSEVQVDEVIDGLITVINKNAVQNKVTSFEPPGSTGFSTTIEPTKGFHWEPISILSNCEFEFSENDRLYRICPIIGHEIVFADIPDSYSVSYQEETLEALGNLFPVQHYYLVVRSLAQVLAVKPKVAVSLGKLGYFRANGFNWSYKNLKEKFPLVIEKFGMGDGTIISSPAGINCGDDCSASFQEGILVTLEAKRGSNSGFLEWGGDCSGWDSIITITLSGPVKCIAYFDFVVTEPSLEIF